MPHSTAHPARKRVSVFLPCFLWCCEVQALFSRTSKPLVRMRPLPPRLTGMLDGALTSSDGMHEGVSLLLGGFVGHYLFLFLCCCLSLNKSEKKEEGAAEARPIPPLRPVCIVYVRVCTQTWSALLSSVSLWFRFRSQCHVFAASHSQAHSACCGAVDWLLRRPACVGLGMPLGCMAVLASVLFVKKVYRCAHTHRQFPSITNRAHTA